MNETLRKAEALEDATWTGAGPQEVSAVSTWPPTAPPRPKAAAAAGAPKAVALTDDPSYCKAKETRDRLVSDFAAAVRRRAEVIKSLAEIPAGADDAVAELLGDCSSAPDAKALREELETLERNVGAYPRAIALQEKLVDQCAGAIRWRLAHEALPTHREKIQRLARAARELLAAATDEYEFRTACASQGVPMYWNNCALQGRERTEFCLRSWLKEFAEQEDYQIGFSG